MKHQIVKICVVFLALLLVIGCSETLRKDKRINTSDGIEVPSDVSGYKASDRAEAKLGGNVKTKLRAVVTLHAVGQGIAPEDATSKGQAIILGECAARANGYVKLAEKIYGVYVESYRQLGRGMIDTEIVRQETQAMLRGAEVLEYRHNDNGIYEAYMRVRIIVNQDSPLFPSGT